MQEQANPKLEIFLGVALIVFAAIVFFGTRSLPAPKYEPLGSAAIPASLAAIVALLSALMIVQAVLRLRSEAPPVAAECTGLDKPKEHPKLAAFVFLLTVCFVAVLDIGLAGFQLAGIVFVTLTGFLLNHRNVRKLPWILLFAVILVISIYQIFTRFFYIDLP